MYYSIEYLKSASDDLEKINSYDTERIRLYIDNLKYKTFNELFTMSKMVNNLYRFRVGDYRIFTNILNNTLIIEVVSVKHRREAYRKR